MRKIRVLVVDDSVVIRRLLTDVLNQDPEIEVVGTAANGQIALDKLSQLNPDAVTLDIEMPVLDGLATLPKLRSVYPKLPVIMFSSLTERGASATLEALASGASDYVGKPTNVGSVTEGMQSVKDQLVPKIKALCLRARPTVASVERQPTTTPPKILSPQRRDVVVIGSSTGGPQALAAVISKLPADLPVPVVVVQHMPPVFTKHLAARLDSGSGLTVSEATDGETLRRGNVLIAPGGFHLELKRDGVAIVTALHEGPPENSCRPAVDVLFRSAANLFGPGCLAVILTGMGQDGLRGGGEIVDAGGTLIAQDEETSVVWGMPRAVTEAGLTQCTLPIGSIANEIHRQASVNRRTVPSKVVLS